MALLLPKSLFIHIPKTGGSWVRKAIRRAGILTDEIIPTAMIGEDWHAMMGHASPLQLHIGDRFRFAFVRHPLSFYQSYWCFKMRTGWTTESAFDVQHSSEDFATFVRSVLKANPWGWLTLMYTRMLGEHFDAVEYIGRTERLADDLVCALTLAGEAFDEEALRATPPENVAAQSPEWQEKCAYDDALRAEVCSVEYRILQHFGYTDAMLGNGSSVVARSASIT